MSQTLHAASLACKAESDKMSGDDRWLDAMLSRELLQFSEDCNVDCHLEANAVLLSWVLQRLSPAHMVLALEVITEQLGVIAVVPR